MRSPAAPSNDRTAIANALINNRRSRRSGRETWIDATGRLIDSRSCVVEPLPPAGGGRPVGGRPRTDSAGSSESLNLCAELGQLQHYVFGNRHRMRYPQFRARGLCISSGVVEAGCKQIGARLKRAGMRWTIAGANAIVALRCCLLSGRFEDFWERRAANAA